MAEGRNVLVKGLSDLLGFEDGTSDVLDHLLTIECREDLLDYLSQLLGLDKADEKLNELVENICRFQNGEELVITSNDTATVKNDNSDQKTSKKPGEGSDSQIVSDQSEQYVVEGDRKNQPLTNTRLSVPIKNTSKSTSKKYQKTATRSNPKSKAPPPPSQLSKSSKPAPPPSGANLPSSNVQQQEQQQRDGLQSQKPSDNNLNEPTDHDATFDATGVTCKPVPKSRPKRGTPRFVCGCFGTFHEPLTNCLFCGRVSCVKEGYDYCPFCGYSIERPPQSSSAADKHKQRLLQFDREYAKRTVVLDDQSDFFVTNQQSLNWSSNEDERRQVLDNQQEKLQQLRERPKMKLELNL